MITAARSARILFAITLAALPPLAVQAQTDKSPGVMTATRQNVLVTIRVSETDDASKPRTRTYQMVTASGGMESRLTTGARVPIPVTTLGTSAAPDGSGPPLMSYQYQEIGFTAEVRVRLEADGRISLQARIEDSHLLPGESARPEIDVRAQKVDALISPGEPLQIFRAGDSSNGSYTLEIEAHVLG